MQNPNDWFNAGWTLMPFRNIGDGGLSGMMSWTTRPRTTIEELLKEFKEKYGDKEDAVWELVGGTELAGRPGKYALIIDADTQEAYEKLNQMLPETRQHKGSKGGHFIFIVDEQSVSFSYKNVAGQPAIEVIGKGKGAVIPPSIHRKTGKPYVVLNDAPIVDIHLGDLIAVLDNVAAGMGLQPPATRAKPKTEIPITFVGNEDVDNDVELIKSRITLLHLGLKEGIQSCPLPGHANGDRHPSLSVFDGGRAFKCFVHDIGGDVFSWVMAQDQCDFKTALRKLAAKAGVELKVGKLYDSKETMPTIAGLQPYSRIGEIIRNKAATFEDLRLAISMMKEYGIKESGIRLEIDDANPVCWEGLVKDKPPMKANAEKTKFIDACLKEYYMYKCVMDEKARKEAEKGIKYFASKVQLENYEARGVGYERPLAEYAYSEKGIDLLEYTYNGGNIDTRMGPVLAGNLVFNGKVIIKNKEDEEPRWHITYEGDEKVGTLDEMVNFIYKWMKTSIRKSDIAPILGTITSKMDIPTKHVYQTNGVQYDFKTDKAVAITNIEDVYPVNEAQARAIRGYEECLLRHDKRITVKDVAQATAEFVRSMPEVNRIPSIATLAFSCIAPLAYVLKQTPLGIFPYLYLQGEKSSAKTSMASALCARLYGQRDLLNSGTQKSNFRASIEFTRSFNPGVIDEADDLFVDNLPLFKSAATNILANTRGTKERGIEEYRAYCSFVFTSNSVPIDPGEDAEGSMMDRLIVIRCGRGPDFDKNKYYPAMDTMDKNGTLFGEFIVDTIVNDFVNEFGRDLIVEEIQRIADKFIRNGESFRRAHCLGEIVYGLRIYYHCLEKLGVEVPYYFRDEDEIADQFYSAIQTQAMEEDQRLVVRFMEWVFGTAAAGGDRSAARGVWTVLNSDEIVISSGAASSFKKEFGMRTNAFKSLEEVCRELRKVGLNKEPNTFRVRDGKQRIWGIRISNDEFSASIARLVVEEEPSQLGKEPKKAYGTS